MVRSISPAFKTQVVLLWNQKSLGLDAILAGESYQLHFPAATSAVAAKFLARKDAMTLGVFGSSGLARQHIATFLVVREFKQIKIYSRNKERRNAFAKEMEKAFSVEALPVDAPEDVVAESDVVVTATDSDVPVFDGNWVEAGTHVSTSVAENKGEAEARRLTAKPREIDDTIVTRSNLIVTNSKEQIILDEQGSIFEPMNKGLVKWDDVHELSSLLLGEVPSRTNRSDITLFLHSGGQGVADVAIAKKILEKAKSRGLGRQITDISE